MSLNSVCSSGVAGSSFLCSCQSEELLDSLVVLFAGYMRYRDFLFVDVIAGILGRHLRYSRVGADTLPVPRDQPPHSI